MSKSRHTPISGTLSRSFGIEDEQDLVVLLEDSGHIVVRKEPTDRKLKRGEKLPEARLKVVDVWEARDTEVLEQAADDVEQMLDALLVKLPVADFGGLSPDKLQYQVKVWLLAKVKQLRDDRKTK